MNAVVEALAYVSGAKTRDVAEQRMDRLFEAVRTHPKQAAALYSPRLRSSFKRFNLVWCMQGTKAAVVRDALLAAAKDKDHWVRWAAVEGLKQFTGPAMIPTFVAASKDRAHLVKSTAAEWLAKHGAQQAVPADVARPASRVGRRG